MPEDDGCFVSAGSRLVLFVLFLLGNVLFKGSAFDILEDEVKDFVLFVDAVEFSDIFVIQEPEEFDLVFECGLVLRVFDPVLDDFFRGVDFSGAKLLGEVDF